MPAVSKLCYMPRWGKDIMAVVSMVEFSRGSMASGRRRAIRMVCIKVSKKMICFTGHGDNVMVVNCITFPRPLYLDLIGSCLHKVINPTHPAPVLGRVYLNRVFCTAMAVQNTRNSFTPRSPKGWPSVESKLQTGERGR